MTFSGRFILNMIDFAMQQGVDRNLLVQMTGYSEAELCEESCRVEEAKYNAIAEQIVALSGDAFWGLHLGEYLNLSAAGLISQITQTSRTVKEALDYCCEFASLGCRALPMELVEKDAHFKLSLIPDPVWLQHSPVAVRHTIDGVVAFTLREFQTLTRQSYFPLAIHYALPAPANAKEYFRVFNCSVNFDQTEFALFFDKAQIKLPILTSDYDLLRVLVAHANEKLGQIEQREGFYGVVKKSIVNLVKPEFPSIHQVAANLNISVRTLQRKLKGEGFTYQKIMEDFRKDFALSYLKNPTLSIKEIAYLLSYADATAFIRSFKRWLGQSPQQYRSAQNLTSSSRS